MSAPRGFFALLLLVVGCAQPPTDELAIAAARVDAARNEDAAVFATELFAEAESSLAEAQRLSRDEGNFLGAIQAAAHATVRANEAFARASSERIVVVRKLDRLIYELGSLLEMAAYRGAESEAAAELSSFRARYEAVRAMEEKRDLLAALGAGTALKPELLAFEERFR
jgi:hypothetical protein